MNIEELRRQFIVDDDVLKARLEPLVSKALAHCRIDKAGQVLIMKSDLSAKQQVRLTLAARALAAQMDSSISAEISVFEIAKCTGLPADQVRARGKDAIEDKFAVSSRRGIYRAVAHKIEPFLDGLSTKL